MSAPGRMTMRAILQRDTQASQNTLGLKTPSFVTQDASLPCWVFNQTKRPERHIDGEKSVTIEELVCMVAKGTDVVAGDRLFSVKDRLGVVLYATPMKIRGVQLRIGGRGHLELTLEDAST